MVTAVTFSCVLEFFEDENTELRGPYPQNILVDIHVGATRLKDQPKTTSIIYS